MGVYHVRVRQNEGTTKTHGTQHAAQASLPTDFSESLRRPGGLIAAPLDPLLVPFQLTDFRVSV
jgi:hypothetical protein